MILRQRTRSRGERFSLVARMTTADNLLLRLLRKRRTQIPRKHFLHPFATAIAARRAAVELLSPSPTASTTRSPVLSKTGSTKNSGRARPGRTSCLVWKDLRLIEACKRLALERAFQLFWAT